VLRSKPLNITKWIRISLCKLYNVPTDTAQHMHRQSSVKLQFTYHWN